MNKVNKNNGNIHIAFVCVENAGRSQMATIFAKEEVKKRDLNIEIITGGTMPAEHVHGMVVEAMQEKGYDIKDQVPRKITPTEIENANYVITMGCPAEDISEQISFLTFL